MDLILQKDAPFIPLELESFLSQIASDTPGISFQKLNPEGTAYNCLFWNVIQCSLSLNSAGKIFIRSYSDRLEYLEFLARGLAQITNSQVIDHLTQTAIPLENLSSNFNRLKDSFTLPHPPEEKLEEYRLKAVVTYGGFFPKGCLAPIEMPHSACEEFEKASRILLLIKKENRPVFDTQDIYGKGYLLTFIRKVLAANLNDSATVHTTSSNSQYVLAESFAEVEVTDFNPQTFMTSYKISQPILSSEEPRELKAQIMDKLDRALSKLGPSREGVSQYYGISLFEELLNSLVVFLHSIKRFSRQQHLDYLQAADLKIRANLVIESLDDVYFNPPQNTNGKLPGTLTSSKSSVDTQKYRDFLKTVNGISEEVKEEIAKKVDYLDRTKVETAEKASTISYLETIMSLPWGRYDHEKLELSEIRKDLESLQYGMKDPKDKLIQYIAVTLNKGDDYKGRILCLIGSPGTGKTMFAKNAAKILKRKIASISLGGMDDVTILRGQRKGWVGAEPGQIVKALVRAKSMNPVIVLDEIDKISGYHGEQVKSSLMEILDPNQNYEFKDAYLDIPLDISRTIFIATANYRSGIPLPLMDRLEIIQIDPYTLEEKFVIAKNYILPQILEEVGLKSGELEISDDVLSKVVDSFRFDAGMRRIAQFLTTIVNKFIVQKVEGIEKISLPHKIGIDDLSKYIKLPDTTEGPFDPSSSIVGEVNTLWVVEDSTGSLVSGGRGCQQIRIVPGSGKHHLTGSLSDISQQSIEVSIGYIQSKAPEFGIERDFFEKHDLLIHAPDIATPKDGPSAGLATTVGILSAIKNLPIPQSYGITGEMDLMGNALKIGGVKLKILGGLRVGIRTFILPIGNKIDFENDVDEEVKKNVHPHFISHISEALNIFFPDQKFAV